MGESIYKNFFLLLKSGLTPLHVAAFMGCMNIVIYLIQHQASPDEATVRGETPLHLAARANQLDIIRILLRNGAKVDARARVSNYSKHCWHVCFVGRNIANFNSCLPPFSGTADSAAHCCTPWECGHRCLAVAVWCSSGCHNQGPVYRSSPGCQRGTGRGESFRSVWSQLGLLYNVMTIKSLLEGFPFLFLTRFATTGCLSIARPQRTSYGSN